MKLSDLTRALTFVNSRYTGLTGQSVPDLAHAVAKRILELAEPILRCFFSQNVRTSLGAPDEVSESLLADRTISRERKKADRCSAPDLTYTVFSGPVP
jgi:hypothetical protein